jgi:hypothetical protein
LKDLIIKGAVLVNGVPMKNGAVLNQKQIKEHYVKYKRPLTDIMHNQYPLDNVYQLGSYINESDEIINGEKVPSGSWIAVMRSSNQELNSHINNGYLQSYSITSKLNQPSKYTKPDYNNTSISTTDPVFISFVHKGNAGFEFEYYDEDEYINNINLEDDNVDLKEFFNKMSEKIDSINNDTKEEQADPDEFITKISEMVDTKISQAFKSFENKLKADKDTEDDTKNKEKSEDEGETKTKEDKEKEADKDTEDDTKNKEKSKDEGETKIENSLNPFLQALQAKAINNNEVSFDEFNNKKLKIR